MEWRKRRKSKKKRDSEGKERGREPSQIASDWKLWGERAGLYLDQLLQAGAPLGGEEAGVEVAAITIRVFLARV